MSNRLIEWCKHNVIRTNLILLVGEVIFASLIWLIFGGRQTFGPLNTYVIVCVSVVIASIAALNSIFASINARDSLTATRKSLELTRKMIRPFLSMSDVMIPVSRIGDNVTLTFKIENSGSLPSNDAHADIDFFDEDEEVTEDNLSNKYRRPDRTGDHSLVFPNNHYYELFILNLQDKDDVELWRNITKGKAKFRLRIMYTTFDNEYITIQTEHIAKPELVEKLQLLPILPQRWE